MFFLFLFLNVHLFLIDLLLPLFYPILLATGYPFYLMPLRLNSLCMNSCQTRTHPMFLNLDIFLKCVAICAKAWGHQLRKQGWFKLWVYCFSLAAVVVEGRPAPSPATQQGDDGESGNQIINDSVYPLEICSHCVSCHHSLPRMSCSYHELADKSNTSVGRAERTYYLKDPGKK